MNYEFHVMPSLLYRRSAHIKWHEFKMNLEKLPKGQSMIVSGFKEELKTVQMRIRAAIRNNGFNASNFRVFKSDGRIIVERKKGIFR